MEVAVRKGYGSGAETSVIASCEVNSGPGVQAVTTFQCTSAAAPNKEMEKSGLETQLQEYMQFLQHLSKDARDKSTAEWVCNGLTYSRKKPPRRPGTAPGRICTQVRANHAEFAERSSCAIPESLKSEAGNFDDPRYVEPASHVLSQHPELHLWEVRSEASTMPSRIPSGCMDGEEREVLKREFRTWGKLYPLGIRSRAWSLESPSTAATTPRAILTRKNGAPQDKVRVCVRMRPFSEHEKVCPLRQVLCSQRDKVIVREYNVHRLWTSAPAPSRQHLEPVLQFDVDYVLDDSFVPRTNREKMEASQRCMFEIFGEPCVENALDGHNSTIMAYGQMGAGKTYTMMGDGTFAGRGLIPRLADELMHRVLEDSKQGRNFCVKVSYLEIYQEKVRDLLAAEKKPEDHKDEQAAFAIPHKNNGGGGGLFATSDGRNSSFSFHGHLHDKREFLRVRENRLTGPYVEGLTWKPVHTWAEMDKLIKQGASNRTLGCTGSHESNLGHTLFTIKLIRGEMCEELPDGTNVSYINLVDLAGSEKLRSVKKRSAERTYESKYINRSLAQLNEVITKLSRPRRNFVSYRSSALTWLLRESLGGKSRTFLVANISPAEQDFQESVHTLRCAAKANRIQNILSVHQDPQKQVYKMNEELRTLHYLIADLTKKKVVDAPAPSCAPTSGTHSATNEKENQVDNTLERQIDLKNKEHKVKNVQQRCPQILREQEQEVLTNDADIISWSASTFQAVQEFEL